MKRLFPSAVVIATSFSLWSCGGDPTGDLRDAPTRLVATPSALFIEVGESETMIVQAEDDAGDPFSVTDVAVASTGPAITVERDPNFLGTTVGQPLESRAQFIVTAATPATTSFTLESSGLTLEVPVRVVPTEFDVVFSNPAPAVNEPVTVTAENFTFVEGSTVVFGSDTAIFLSRAPDGTSLTFLPPPGTASTAVVNGAVIGVVPGVPLSVETTSELSVLPLVPLTGTDAPGTAPAITIPPIGSSTVPFFDGGTYDYPAPIFGGAFGDFPARLYEINIPVDGQYTFTLDWPSAEDLGIYFFETDGTTETGQAKDGATSPEEGAFLLTAGTYLMAIVNFAETAPAYISLAVEAAPPPET